MNEQNIGVIEDHPPSVDLFSEERQTEKDMLSGRTVVYHSNLGNTHGPYEFTVESDGPEYISLPQTRLLGRVKITRSTGYATEAAETEGKKLGICNLLPSALFQQVLVELNSQLITDSSAKMYPYKAYLETLLSYGSDATDSHLQTSRWWPDTADHFTQTAAAAGADAAAIAAHKEVYEKSGFYCRSNWLQPQGTLPAKSYNLDFCTPIFTDFFRINRLLPDKCQLRIKFDRGMDSFPIICDDNIGYNIEITDLQLHIRKVNLSERIRKHHENLFIKRSAVFPIHRTVMSSYVLPTGITSYIIPRVIKGQLPKTVILGLINSRSFNGDQKYNPFKFEHAGLTQINLRVDGVSVPARPYKSDFTAKSEFYCEPYAGLMNSLGYDGDNRGCNIGHHEYANGYTLFGFDLSPDQCSGFHKHEKHSGTVDVEMTFKSSFDTIYTLISYSIYDNNLFINKNRNLSADYLF